MGTLAQTWLLVQLGSTFYPFGFAPLLLLALAHRRAQRKRWWFDIGLTVVIAWVVICTYRLGIEVPVGTAWAYSHGDFMYDGVGGNVATCFVTGWLIPVMECCAVRVLFIVPWRDA